MAGTGLTRSGGGAHSKGAGFERSICKRLSLWVTDGRADDALWRTSNSGARFTSRRKTNKQTLVGAGDITAVTPEGQPFANTFVGECKHWDNLHLNKFFYTNREGNELLLAWRKVIDEAKHTGKRPLLIAKADFFPELVFLDMAGIQFLGRGFLEPDSIWNWVMVHTRFYAPEAYVVELNSLLVGCSFVKAFASKNAKPKISSSLFG